MGDPSPQLSPDRKSALPGLRILIADDHDLMRRGLRALLESHPGWEFGGHAANGREAVALTEELNPDIIEPDGHY